MNVLFMIGNGFDRNLGMRTAFSHFYQYYCSLPSDVDAIKRVKEEITDKKYIDWSDLEEALGNYSNIVDSEEEYKMVIRDIEEKLGNYLESEYSNYRIGNNIQELNKNFTQFGLYFSDGPSELVENLLNIRERINIDIMSFNYTKTVERVINSKLPLKIGEHFYDGTPFAHVINSIRHIHGTLDDAMLLGVNDESQISNEKMRVTEVTNYLIKPIMNDNTKTMRNFNCSRLINNADLIVIFGMSLGKTDKYWWEKVVSWLINRKKSYLFIVNYNSNISLRTRHYDLEIYNSYIEKLLSHYSKNITEEIKKDLYDRIFVELNTKMFKFECIRKEEIKIKKIGAIV